jgi:PST family polysaccharide transporter
VEAPDHDPPSVGGSTAVAVEWRCVAVAARFLLKLGITVVLARLVSPRDFGIVAIALIIVDFAARISEIGFSPAIVQRADLNDLHIRVAFTLAAGLGAAFTVAMALTAPVMAAFFRAPDATAVLRAVSLVFLLSSLSTVSTALLQRRLAIRRLLVVDVGSYVVGFGAIGITLAVLGFGAWALVWASLGQAAARAAFGIVAAPHAVRPALLTRESRQLVSFAAGNSLTGCLNYAAANGDYFVIGRALGPAPLGLYNRAYHLMTLPVGVISSVLGFVLLSTFSKLQGDAGQLRAAFLRAVRLSTLLVYPMLAAMIVMGPELVTGLYGPNWAAATTAFQLLCLGGLLSTVNTLLDALIKAKGAVFRHSLRQLAYAAAVVTGSAAGSRWGIEGAAIGVDAALLLTYVLLARLVLSLLRMRGRDVLAAQAPALVVAAAVAAAAGATRTGLVALGIGDVVTAATTVLAASAAALIVFSASWWPLKEARGLFEREVRRGLAMALRRSAGRHRSTVREP